MNQSWWRRGRWAAASPALHKSTACSLGCFLNYFIPIYLCNISTDTHTRIHIYINIYKIYPRSDPLLVQMGATPVTSEALDQFASAENLAFSSCPALQPRGQGWCGAWGPRDGGITSDLGTAGVFWPPGGYRSECIWVKWRRGQLDEGGHSSRLGFSCLR